MDESRNLTFGEKNQQQGSIPGSFAGNAVKLAVGSGMAQMVTILAAPILTRIYQPAAFGVLALYFSFVNIFSEIACLRYDHSIMVAKQDEEAANQAGVSCLIAFLFSLLLSLLIGYEGERLASWLNAPDMIPLLWMIPPAVFLGAGVFIMGFWSTRKNRFARVAAATTVNAVVAVIVQFIAAAAGETESAGLVSGAFYGQAAGFLFLSGGILFNDARFLAQSIRVKRMLEGLIRYRKFPLYESWAGLLNVSAWQLPFFVLAIFFNATVVGYYSVVGRVLQIPMRMVGLAIGQSFFAQAAQARQEGTLLLLVRRVFHRLVLLSLFPLLLLTVSGSDLFFVVFGAEWKEAGYYLQLLAPWVFFWFISYPLGTLYSVLEMQEYSLRMNLLAFSTRLISLIVGGWSGSPTITFIIFSLSGVISYGYYSLSVTAAAGMPRTDFWRVLWQYGRWFLPAGALLHAFVLLRFNSWVVTVLSIILLAGYGYFAFRSDETLVQLASRIPVVGRLIKKLLKISLRRWN